MRDDGARARKDGARHLRVRGAGEQSTAPVELLFDLVYVFAITQLSHLLIGHLDTRGLAQTTFLLIVVWWAWINTTWTTNLLDPASTPVRLLLLACAASSLLMAAALPQAFGADGAVFAIGFVVLQVGRNVVVLGLLRRDAPLRRPFARLTAWSAASGALWIAGGLTGQDVRAAVWIAAVVIDLVGPRVQYATPWLGRGTTADWDVDGGHFAERFQLLIMIALGESIVVSGATASIKGLSSQTVAALLVTFAETAGLWWLYFEQVAETSRRIIARHDEAGRLARDAFTYLHIPIVAGIIGTAAGVELVILHPGDPLSGMKIGVVLGAPLLYLTGEAGFRWVMARRVSPARITTMALIVACTAPAPFVPAIVTEIVLTGLLGGLAWVEYRANRPAAGIAEPAP